MRTIFGISGILLIAAMAMAQSTLMEQGQEYNKNKQWSKAETVFSQITDRDPSNKEAWFYLGQAQQEEGKPQEALEAFAQAEGIPSSFTNRLLFRQARAYAALGQKDKALDTLEKLVAAGFVQEGALYSTSDFESVRADPRFAKIRQTIDDHLHPCQHDVRYRAFDFWVGEWEVRPSGQADAKPSRSSIQRILGSCVIFENYTAANGAYEGKSFNVFDALSGQWHQVYVDSTGTDHQWYGQVRDNVMYYVGANLDPNGGRTWDKITYFKLPNGHVRHLSEQSNDGGKTWNTYFDGDYSPVAAQH